MMRRRIGSGLWLIALAAALADATMDQLGWMTGSWAGEQDGLKMEEHWTRPAGDLMVGMHRDVSAAGKTHFEFLRIAKQADGISYIAMPSGRGETAFKLVESGPGKAVFENLQHDYPQRIAYWLTEDGRLHAKVEGPMKGKNVSEEWAWTRTPLTP